MARGSQQANAAATAAQGISTQNNANAQALYGALAPELESQMANPAGISPADLAKMDTASKQTAGGSQAAAQGAGSLLASRTRNAGTASAAIADSTRTAGQNLSRATLGTQLANAEMKQREREAATGELGGLLGMTTGASVGALGQVANNVNANTNAENASWDWAKYIMDPMMSAAGSTAGGYLSHA